MPKHNRSSRRKFLQQLGGTAMLLSGASLSSFAGAEVADERILRYEKKISANDAIRIGVIGMGIMGNNDLETALKVPGVELVAASDLYTGRLQRVKERYGNNIYTTRDYRELLQRKDIDAVIIATSDHWHSRISVDAMNAGKAVYCEKPMVHKVEQGAAVIEAQNRTKKTFQVGSQRVSSIALEKAREVFASGEIGQLGCIEATLDRQSALGAWEYTMPTDASPQTVDWDRYIEGMPKASYDPKKFFWWRNYRAFGTGVAGDLFVHLLSGIHLITGSMGPEKIYASGSLSYWKDGRDVPDIMTAIMHYPATDKLPSFELMLRVNFISAEGESGGTKFIGSEGVMDVEGNNFTVRHRKMSKAPGIGGWDALTTYPKAMQDELLSKYNQQYSAADQQGSSTAPTIYKAPDNYDEHLDHFTHFFDGVRTGKPVVEDAVFGFRAAGPCLCSNESYFQNKIIHWDPVNMKLKS